MRRRLDTRIPTDVRESVAACFSCSHVASNSRAIRSQFARRSSRRPSIKSRLSTISVRRHATSLGVRGSQPTRSSHATTHVPTTRTNLRMCASPKPRAVISQANVATGLKRASRSASSPSAAMTDHRTRSCPLVCGQILSDVLRRHLQRLQCQTLTCSSRTYTQRGHSSSNPTARLASIEVCHGLWCERVQGFLSSGNHGKQSLQRRCAQHVVSKTKQAVITGKGGLFFSLDAFDVQRRSLLLPRSGRRTNSLSLVARCVKVVSVRD